MASSPTTSWQIDGETMETVTDFIFLGFKITADGGCSHEIKRHLLLGRKAMTNLESPLPFEILAKTFLADRGSAHEEASSGSVLDITAQCIADYGYQRELVGR